MKSTCFLLLSVFLFLSTLTLAQTTSIDSLANNLIHASGYQTAPWGSLPYQKTGNGKQSLLILPGWGFDGSVFHDFVRNNLSDYTVYLLTLPGYGTTRLSDAPGRHELRRRHLAERRRTRHSEIAGNGTARPAGFARAFRGGRAYRPATGGRTARQISKSGAGRLACYLPLPAALRHAGLSRPGAFHGPIHGAQMVQNGQHGNVAKG